MAKQKTGWLKISRGIVLHWLWEDANRLKWWLDLLLMAAYEKKSVYVNTRLVEVQRGQMVASLAFLCQRWGISKPTLLTFLKLLESEGMIERTLDHNISLLTICNYETYQTSDKEVLDNLLDNPTGGSEVDNQTDNLTCSESASSEGESATPIDNLIDNTFDILLYTRKEIKNNNQQQQDACDRESMLMEDMRQNEIWQVEAICMKYKISVAECLQRINEFELDCKCQNKVHTCKQDIYQHFSNWLRIRIENERRDEANRQGVQDRRRGTEVSATSPKDYTSMF